MSETAYLSEADLRAIAERALPAWGIDPQRLRALELVSRSENSVLRVALPDDRAYALRIHRPGYHTLNELESELLWTQALSAAGVRVPVGVRTLDGPGYAVADTPDGQSSRAVGLVEWIPGRLLGPSLHEATDSLPLTARFRQLGRIAAAIHNQAVAWSPPPGFRRHSFDVPGYVGETPFWGRFWDLPILTSPQRDVLGRARSTLRSALLDYGRPSDRFSMIHADLHLHNVMIDPDGTLHVIDFDDAGFGWHQYDLATALFGLEDRPDFERIESAMVEGYRMARDWSDSAQALLPLFLLIRRLALIGWQWDRPELGARRGVPLEAYIADACERADAFEYPTG